jgi:hypothetical protein
MSDGGKGSAPRPFSVSDEVFASNFDRIFGKKQQAHEKDRVYFSQPSDSSNGDLLSKKEKEQNDNIGIKS